MKKAAALVIIFILTTTLMAGCSFSTSKEEVPAQSQKAANTQNDGSKAPAGGQKAPADPVKNQSPAPVKTADKPDVKRDSGRYTGQIDSNFIEIKISGVPENIAARSFMLDERVKGDFGKLGLKKDDQIQFAFTENSSGQWIIVEIKKILP